MGLDSLQSSSKFDGLLDIGSNTWNYTCKFDGGHYYAKKTYYYYK